MNERDFASTPDVGKSFRDFVQSIPAILAGRELREIVSAVAFAQRAGKPILWGFGAHVIKCGLSPVIIDLIHRGLISGIALNGAGIVHDYELAATGSTSEDVSASLPQGGFGVTKETAEFLNMSVREGRAENLGLGESVGRALEAADLEHKELSILRAAYHNRVPVTVHVALGTDVLHIHPNASGSDIGAGSHHDFRVFCSLVAGLNGGGVYLNVGSAVILPEVFLKAVAAVRGSGQPLSELTTVNLDFIRHYRPQVNVLERPTQSGGRGLQLVGHHELLLPLIAWGVLEELKKPLNRVP